jgi:hypothetical protein
MRLLIFLVPLLLAGAACGASDPAHTPLVFGVGGGNMVPYRVTIQPNGVVRATGSVHPRRRHLPVSTVQRLRNEVLQAHLTSRDCQGTLPDVGRQYIRAGSRTWTVHGGCEKRFARAWGDLARAVGLALG